MKRVNGNPNQIRQGDLLFVRIDKIPSGAKKTDNILARGEFSDHAHVIVSGGEVLEDRNGKYVNVEDTEAVVKHLYESKYKLGEIEEAEHGEITLPGGKWKVISQTEYNPYEKAARKVVD